jgi:quercetin dioxygenase-like cupin family protein
MNSTEMNSTKTSTAPDAASSAFPTGPLIVRRRGLLPGSALPGAVLAPLLTARDGEGEAEAAELQLEAGARIVLAPAGCDVLAYGLAGAAELGGAGLAGELLVPRAALRVPAGGRVELHADESGATLAVLSYGAGLAGAVQPAGPAATASSAHAEFTAADGGTLLGVANDLVRVLVSGGQTQRKYALGTVTERPGGGPPPHTHAEAELFYVVDGQFRFWTLGPDGPLEFAAGPGDCVLVGHGQPHTFTLAQAAPGTAFVLTWDSGLEDMFHAIGAPVSDAAQFLAAHALEPTPQQLAQLVEAVSRFGMQVLMP